MAWEEIKRQGQVVMTGDKPVDEMALSLRKLAQLYEDRWDRKPLLREILYAFELVVQSAPETYLSDPEEAVTQKILF